MKLTLTKHSVILILLTSACILMIASASFAQAINQDKQNLKLISIVSQPDCPLVLTPAGVDDSNEGITVLKFDVRNFSERKIKAFSISRSMLGDEKIRGLITFIISFNAGETTEGWASEAKVNINSDSKILLAVDYVLFDDGGFWGKDSRKESGFISAYPEGQKKALSEIKKLIDKLDEIALLRLFDREITKLDSLDIDKNKSDEWRIGYLCGYKVVLAELKTMYQKQGLSALPSTLETFNELVKPIRVGM